ncbi:unnamed protein product [Moneuplotes crassus]|uniref:Uncharacterized protein n=1 Tax=Euplotes crassus TaxID=5936 RepID=A0AAD1Y918_EUPCR|nr:unnamed protein product [Moneuplotes crassus]
MKHISPNHSNFPPLSPNSTFQHKEFKPRRMPEHIRKKLNSIVRKNPQLKHKIRKSPVQYNSRINKTVYNRPNSRSPGFQPSLKTKMKRTTVNKKNFLENFKIQRSARSGLKNKNPKNSKLFRRSPYQGVNEKARMLSPRTFLSKEIAPRRFSIMTPNKLPSKPNNIPQVLNRNFVIPRHKKCGQSPPVIRLKKSPREIKPVFEVYESPKKQRNKFPAEKSTTKKLFDYLNDNSDSSPAACAPPAHKNDSQFFYNLTNSTPEPKKRKEAKSKFHKNTLRFDNSSDLSSQSQSGPEDL